MRTSLSSTARYGTIRPRGWRNCWRPVPILTRSMNQGRTPLSQAVEAKATDMVAQLLATGANPNMATPLHRAMGMRYLEGGQALLAAVTAPNAVTASGYTPLHEAAGTSLWEGIRMLLAAGADPDARMNTGETPLLWASRYDDPTTAAVLLAAGTNPDARTEEGETPLSIARRHYRQYDPSRRIRGLSASLQAIRCRRAAAMIELLRTHGARE